MKMFGMGKRTERRGGWMSDVKILFFSYDYNYSRNRVLIKGLKKNDVDVIKWDVPYTTHTISRYVKLLREYTTEYDVIIMGFPGGRDNIPLAKSLALFNRKPVIFDAFISQYDTKIFDRKVCDDKSLRAKQYFYSDKIPCSMADIVLLDTNEHIDYFVNTFNIPREKFRRVFVGADEDVFYPVKAEKENNKFKVLFYGNYIPLHGIEYIVEAAKLLEDNKDIEFEIFGSGQTYKYIMKLSKKLEIKNILFKKDQVDADPQRYITTADVCLGIFGDTPKAKRVIPNKAFQAIAMKKSLLTGDTPAAREIFLNEQNAILCQVADPQAIAEAILLLKEDEKLRTKIAENGYRLFKEKFTPQAIGKEVRMIIEEFMDNW